VKKKGKEQKSKLIEQLVECASLYERCFVFRATNMRNEMLKELRQVSSAIWRNISVSFS